MNKPITIDLDVLTEKTVPDKVLFLPYAELLITSDCNFRCTYCFEDKEAGKKMKIEDIQPFIEQNGAFELNMFGGEPFTNSDLIDQIFNSVHRANLPDEKKEIVFNSLRELITNGSLLTKEKNLDMIKKHKINLQVSIDGDKEAHDLRRVFNGKGAGTFDIIMKNLKEVSPLITEEEINIAMHGVMDAITIKQMESSIIFLFEKFAELYNYDTAIKQLNSNMYQIVFEDDYDDRVIDIVLQNMVNVCKYFWNHKSLTQPQRRTAINNFLTPKGGICGAGHSLYAVNPDMEVFACHRVSDNALSPPEDQKLGNLYDPEHLQNQGLFNSYYNLGVSHQTMYSYKFLNYGYEKKENFRFNWCPATNIQQSTNLYFVPVKYAVLTHEMERLSQEILKFYVINQ